MQVLARSGKSLAELAQVMVRFPQVLINVKGVRKEELASSTTISDLVAHHTAQFGDAGRILVRASGTEPLIRVMVEAESDLTAKSVAEEIAALVESELKF